MKKFYNFTLFTVLLCFGITNVSGQLIMHSQNVKKDLKFNTSKKSSELFAQYPNSNSGIASFIDQDDEAYLAADDFQLAETSKINTMQFIGFQQNGTLEELHTGVLLFIYEDDNGKPAGIPGKSGTPILMLDLAKSDPRLTVEKIQDVYYDYQISDLNFTAEANKKYWVSFAPKIDFTEKFMPEEMFSWLNGVTFNFNDAVNIDRDNFYDVGMTYWLSATEMTGGVFGDELKSLCFALYGEPLLKVNNQNLQSLVTISPNPASDFISINTQNNVAFKHAEVIDLTGKKVAEGRDNINIQKLPKGVYVVNIILDNGEKVSKKIIKK